MRPRAADSRPCGKNEQKNKKSLRHNFLVTEAVKIQKLSRFHSGLSLCRVIKTRCLLTVALRKTILAVLKKQAFPFCAHRVHFSVLKQVNFQLFVHLSGAQVIRLLLPVIAFIILNLIYHNKKRNASFFYVCNYLSWPSLL